jgi:hypothetical protein
MSCQGKAIGLTTARHNILRDALFDLSRQAHWKPVKDAPLYLHHVDANGVSHSLRPADLAIQGDLFPHRCVDCTLVSPVCPSNLTHPFRVGAAAEFAAESKMQLYAQRCLANNLEFSPFAVDTFGILSTSAVSFLERLATRINRSNFSSAMSLISRRISFAIHLGVAKQLVSHRCAIHLDSVTDFDINQQ